MSTVRLVYVIVGSYKVSLSAVQRAALVRAGTIRQLCDRCRSSPVLRGRTTGSKRRHWRGRLQ